MMPFPPPPRPSATAPRMIVSESRAEVAAALLGHLQDEDQATGLLDLAELDGDAQTERARVTFDGSTWTADLFGQRREAAS